MAKNVGYDLLTEDEKNIRKMLFHPCYTQQHLKDYLNYFFNIELPDYIVDPESNTTPFHLIWDIYSLALQGGDENRSRNMAYASRAGMKTLDAALLEVLVVLHAKRDVVHLAAQEDQSEKCQEYVRNFIDIPSLRPFVEGDRKRTIEILRYEHSKDPNHILTKDEYLFLTQTEQEKYIKIHLKIEVAICTLAGTNSKHSTFMVVDEVDVIANPKAYQEAKSIPKGRDGKLPITLLTSTRKSSYGKVQEEIDKANKTGLQIYHWNILDVTEKCPEKRHLPLLPKVPVYIDRNELTSILEEEYNSLPENKQQKYEQHTVFSGCVNCPIVAACRGHLAKQQSKAKMLSQLSDTILTIRDAGDANYVNAQYLCTKPNSEGLIYPRLDKELHLIDLNKFCDIKFKRRFENLPLNQFIRLCVEEYGAKVSLGIDFGHTHPFAVSAGLCFEDICLIFGALEQSTLEEQEQIAITKEKYEKYNPTCWADMAMPGAIKAFKTAGFKMKLWKKGPGSVLDGINIVRTKIRPTQGEPQIYFLKEGEGVQGLFSRLEKYHRARDNSGKLLDDPEKKDDDGPDSLRYLIMNAYPINGSTEISVPPIEDTAQNASIHEMSDQEKRQLHWKKQILEHIGIEQPKGIIGVGKRIKMVS